MDPLVRAPRKERKREKRIERKSKKLKPTLIIKEAEEVFDIENEQKEEKEEKLKDIIFPGVVAFSICIISWLIFPNLVSPIFIFIWIIITGLVSLIATAFSLTLIHKTVKNNIKNLLSR